MLPNEVQKEFIEKCGLMAARFEMEAAPSILQFAQEDIDLLGAVGQMQTFLNEATNELLFKESDISVTSLAREVKGLKQFRFKVGLVSALSLLPHWTEDRGTPFYHFWLGESQHWENHIKNRCSCGDGEIDKVGRRVSRQLCQGVPVEERIFSQKNASGRLLAASRPGIIPDQNLRGLVVLEPSEGGISHKEDFKRKYPWALVTPEDFPQIYSLVSKTIHPLGFTQISIELPSDLYSAGNLKYSGPDVNGLNICNPMLEWVQDLVHLICNFNMHFVAKFLTLISDIKAQYFYKRERARYFPQEFIEAVKIADAENCRKTYESSRWWEEISEMQACLKYTRLRPSTLAMGIIDEFWQNDEIMKEQRISKRFKAEAALFWENNYREHFVHLIKVFLLGERIITEIIKKLEPAKKKIEEKAGSVKDFEELWMLAATIHDHSIPLTDLPKLQKAYWKEFLGMGFKLFDESFEERTFLKLQNQQTLAEVIFRDHMLLDYLALMHPQSWPWGNDQDDVYFQFQKKKNIEKPEMLYPDYLRHFQQEWDHGIASALWYLNKAFEYSGWKPKTAPEVAGKKKRRKMPTLEKFRKYMAVAHAIFFHDLATATERDDENRLIFESTLKINFEENPLTFLLLLCDILQDEGRPESFEITCEKNGKQLQSISSSRPIAHIHRVEVVEIGNEKRLEIEIEYCWVDKSPNVIAKDRVKLWSKECEKAKWTQCTVRRTDDKLCAFAAGAGNKGNCKNHKKVKDFLGNVASDEKGTGNGRLQGLPITIIAKQIGRYYID